MDESWTKKKSEHWITDRIVVLGDSWESLGLQGDQTSLKEINPKYLLINIYPEAEILILGPPDAKSRLTGKDSDAANYWRQEEKGLTEDEMVGWHHWLNGHESERTLGSQSYIQSMGSQGVGHDWAPEMNWAELISFSCWKELNEVVCRVGLEVHLIYGEWAVNGCC